ncbi:3-hydroxyacyl-CoA dehydratase, Delta(3),delta(2)-enoyl CoA isomerases [Klebsormidium nitens]|uniref:Delta(3)-Delta(2)-enoyl-CoA isomerase n=1 Tax=Klebsormidium nitens TaxID=105231 RepID=A0A1Y1I9W5_KLENI|nr:3-hydroxyacyl-CoA dehydratase, Delta(3),delta(2)-enoyl CoA isomerases [Klebsormidium nitens]|eukprot:GAQ86219.1 3-hydroxyacyl-CoA dehydratase, Delta(3),delta(2)-enoyl CoA isomerases [Klebsormidium nitens]
MLRFPLSRRARCPSSGALSYLWQDVCGVVRFPAVTNSTSAAKTSDNLFWRPFCAAPADAQTRLDHDKRNGVYTLTFLGQGEHRINPAFVAEVERQLDTVLENESPIALVTANEGRFWCNGLDIDWVKEDPKIRLEPGVLSLLRLVKRFLELPIPTVASINGHAAGGGFVLALANDYRYMRRSKSVLYLSGVDIGLPHPPGANALLRSKMRPEVYRDAVLYGMKFNGDMAASAGLVQCDPLGEIPWDADVLKHAEKFASFLARRKFDREVYGAMKRDMYSEALELLENGGIGQLGSMGLFGKILKGAE